MGVGAVLGGILSRKTLQRLREQLQRLREQMRSQELESIDNEVSIQQIRISAPGCTMAPDPTEDAVQGMISSDSHEANNFRRNTIQWCRQAHMIVT